MFGGYWTFPSFSQSEVRTTGNFVELSLIKQILKLKTFYDNSFQVSGFFQYRPGVVGRHRPACDLYAGFVRYFYLLGCSTDSQVLEKP